MRVNWQIFVLIKRLIIFRDLFLLFYVRSVVMNQTGKEKLPVDHFRLYVQNRIVDSVHPVHAVSV